MWWGEYCWDGIWKSLNEGNEERGKGVLIGKIKKGGPKACSIGLD